MKSPTLKFIINFLAFFVITWLSFIIIDLLGLKLSFIVIFFQILFILAGFIGFLILVEMYKRKRADKLKKSKSDKQHDEDKK